MLQRLITLTVAALVATASCYAGLVEKTYQVDGIIRHVLLHEGLPSPEGRPLILAFHGYSGNNYNFAKSVHFETLWPEAMVAYIQGLVVPSDREDGRIPAGKERPGWQRTADMDGGRDLKLVDVLVEELSREYNVDKRRVYAAGFSNGAVFTWVLVAARPNLFAAYAPVAGIDKGNLDSATQPKPVIFHFGEKDTAFKVGWAISSIRRMKKLNQSKLAGKEWAPGYVLYEPQKSDGAPLIVNLHPGGHEFPSYAANSIVAFFKSQSLD